MFSKSPSRSSLQLPCGSLASGWRTSWTGCVYLSHAFAANMSEPTAPRQIAPGPSSLKSDLLPGDSPPGENNRTPMDPSKKRVSMACLACKKSKRKCSGVPPCDNCRAFNRQCIFDETLDQRRRVAAKRTADELSYHRDMLNDLLRVMRADDRSFGLRLLDIIRRDATAEEMRGFIDEALAQMEGTDSADEVTMRKLEDVRRVINVEGAGPSFRPKVMDIHYLCDEVPFRVPAKPWTTITEDADLVSHLISLYFTWDFPFHAFLDREVFLRDMAMGDLNSEFCSPFLVNALLANACHFSDYLEAYVDPGDIVTKGADFLAEAERLRDEEPAKLSLAFLQGTLLLYERYSISGHNDLGYKMLHQAIWTGESLGLIGPKVFKLGSGQLTEDMKTSIKRTAWGLFHIDTVVHTDFLRPSLIDKVNLERPDSTRMDETALWVPYPSHRAPRPSLLSQYFDESWNLCEIARDISQQLYAINGSSFSAYHQRRTKEALYERLWRWYQGLPDTFNPDRNPPPYIILLRMRYHTLTINLFSWRPEDDVSSVDIEAPKTPESPPGFSLPRLKFDALENILSSARAISALARLYRREYGMSRAHHFALYAINLALFTMLDCDGFDILDQDFLSLTSAFISLTSRSQLGRNLFHLFRQSVLGKGQGQRASSSSAVNDELKALFTEDISSPSRWDGYDKGLEKLNEDERYHGIPGEGDHSLFDMLDCYESLSLGKDEIAPERYRPEAR
ncbi:Zn(II)2Cys6 transcription factor [Aspergillus alliaceus]|uniref:Zn(II)2Cys6 transcription factor n=1 Tax=Petromyces alliaceus TaxID=209559 RepID=UPI0012A3D5A9|nr:fungal-specific transcription factor domain-containing protein [Aspergillus alliaceus]KAB8227453.1 fungal-specific transcription factor domain-containing protein [Aspergillus alliaceus]